MPSRKGNGIVWELALTGYITDKKECLICVTDLENKSIPVSEYKKAQCNFALVSELWI